MAPFMMKNLVGVLDIFLFIYTNFCIGEYKNAVMTSILDISGLEDVARLNVLLSYTLILRA